MRNAWTWWRPVGVALAVLAVGIFPAYLATARSREAARVEAPAAVEPARYRLVELAGRDLDHRLRGDWEPADEIVLAFTEEWQESLAQVVAAAVDQTRVTLLVDPQGTAVSEVEGWLDRFGLSAQDVRLMWIPRDTPWVRDYGPLQVMPAGEDGEPLWLDPRYSEARPQDDAVPPKLGAVFGVEVQELPFPLQGGALASNGRGLCASTLEYFDEKGIDVDDSGLMADLLDRLGCRAFVLVPALAEEPTRHVDMFVQFTGPDVVAVAAVDPSDDAEDAARMDDAARGLKDAAERLGQPLRIVRVPMPYLGGGQYFTYVNGVRLLGDFLVPSYRVPPRNLEMAAFRLLSSALVDAAVVDVPADRILPLSGSLHCISVGLTLPRRSPAARRPGRGP